MADAVVRCHMPDRLAFLRRPPASSIGDFRGVLGALAVLLVGVGVVAAAMAGYRVHDELTRRHLSNAVFGPAPLLPAAHVTLQHVWDAVRAPDGATRLLRFLPNQAGVLWLSSILLVVLAIDFTRRRGGRNVDIAALVVLGALLFDSTRYLDDLTDATTYQLMDWAFAAIMATSLVLLARGLWWSRRDHVPPWRPGVARPSLAALALLMVALDVGVVLIREPDDAGFYTNLGAQRLRERGEFPYGDPLLSGSAGAGYGPVLFLAHLPFQMALDRQPVNRPSLDFALRGPHGYRLPPMQASQLATLAFHAVGVVALLVAARRLAGIEAAWGIVVLYCGSAFILGVGGDRQMIGGLTFISHIAPASLTLLAFALLDRPFLSGLCMAMSVATVFAPAYFIPAWIGYHARRRRDVLLFVAGLAVAALVIGAPVLARSRATEGRSVIGTVLHDSIGHHQGSDAYGQSPFGFWGGRGGVRAALRDELVPGLSLSSPIFAVTTAFALAGFFLGRGRTPRQLAALTAALGIAAQLWKIHGTGVYVAWYYPFLLLGVLAVRPEAEGERQPRERAS